MKMLQYTVKRFVIMLFTLFIIATATFFLLAATPGDALSARVEKLPDSVAARMYAARPSSPSSRKKPPSRPGWASSRCCWAFPSAWHWACWQP